ncbi:CotD family spore coat protein [Aquibacillus albus]|uniref:Spore coat protein D n=1 Tax=Aquibacillus albus TaxID=1168171 RepID=A0ABS2MVP9_9BACI|nr:CotD family spore coat protein [Aquibacillus albus]MBM7569868.1 spore coat protein D [Aquibacillus albus]
MRHHKPFGCPKPVDTVVYPTKYNEVHTCSESNVKHVHPAHTNVVNHHLVKNIHEYPHSTSYGNTVDSVNIYGGSYEVPSPPRPNVQPTPPFGPGPGAGGPAGGPGPGAVGPAGGPGPGSVGPTAGPGPGVGPVPGSGPISPANPSFGKFKGFKK